MRKLSLIICSCLLALGAAAMENPFSQKTPIDSSVIQGVLPNGMRYYIVGNSKPENMADFYIVHNVGAMQEEDNQNGLAHFLEHMAFNGTKNYPGKDLLNYMESIGVQFGRNINASTSQEQTIYMLSDVPISRKSVIDSALLVLNDWSYYITLDEEEIEKERGVILEEMRTGLSAGRRTFNKAAPLMFNNTKYADRLVIGTEDVVANFDPKELMKFYHDWYRTDQQAIIAVGDFDPISVEKSVIERFSKIPAVESPKEKEVVTIPPYSKNEVIVVTDPEQGMTMCNILTPVQTLPLEFRNSMFAYALNLTKTLAFSIINERLDDLSKEADAPFLGAGVGEQDLTRYNNTFYSVVASKEGELAKGVDAVTKELQRFKKHGFSEAALERAKSKMVKSFETEFNNREARKNGSYVSDIINSYLSNEPLMSLQQEYEVAKPIIESVTLESINEIIGLMAPDAPSALVIYAPEKDGIVPNGEEILASYEAAIQSDVDRLEESSISVELMEQEPKAVKIAAPKTDIYGNSVWKLKNGATVVLRTTDFKQDEILFSSFKDGGVDLTSDEDILAANLITSYLSIAGVSDFSGSDLRKMLSGKSVSVRLNFSDHSTSLSGSSSVSDVKEMFQLIHLTYTEPRYDQQNLDFLKQQIASIYQNIDTDPDVAFADSVSLNTYHNSPRLVTSMRIKDETDGVTLSQIEKVYSTMMDGVDDTHFIFVGNIDQKGLEPYIAQYIATLPKGRKGAINRDVELENIEGVAETVFKRKQENPKAKVNVEIFSDGFKNTLENSVVGSAFRFVINNRYLEVIREEKGATYGVRTSGGFDPITGEYRLVASFDTNGKQAEEAADLVISELEDVAQSGIKESDLNKAKEVFLKNFTNGQKENSSWMGWITSLYRYDIDNVNEYVSAVESLTIDDIKEFAAKLLEDNNKLKVIMLPE